MMNDKLREAAKAAYKAMIAAELSDGSKREWDAAVDGLKDALAEPAIKESLTGAEPVGKFSKFSDGVWKEVTASSPGILLYPAPPRREWVGLTQTQVKLLREGVHEESIKTGDSIDWIFYTHINESLKEKNGG